MHQSVLLHEVLTIFDPQPGKIYIDATINGGGHARAIAERVAPDGKLLGIDWDCELIKEARIKNQESRVKNIVLVCGNYTHIKTIAERERFGKVHGILFDLGFSSYHIEKSGRGFSFLRDEPLDMRYHGENFKLQITNSKENIQRATDIVNRASQKELEQILRDYGEERFAKQIARGITEERKKRLIERTFQLVEIVKNAVPAWYTRKKIHFATKTFQALRIAVNHELKHLEYALRDSFELLAPGGKIIVISFHSLEDRIVKNIFREQAKRKDFHLLTKHVARASREEVIKNPRARSARLRALQYLLS